MGFRFRKSVKIAKGVKLNLGSKSWGVSVGGKGARIGFNSKKGSYVSAGIPGTGLYGIEYFGGNNSKNNSSNSYTQSPYMQTDSMPLPREFEANAGLGYAWSVLSFILLISVPVLGFLSIIGQFTSMYLSSKSLKGQARKLFLSGKNLYNSQNYSEALKKFNETLALYPNLFSLHSILGDIYFQIKNFKEAVFHYEELLKHENSLEFKFKLGNVYILNNQIQEAINVFQSFPSPYKEDLTVICSLANCFIELNNYKAALDVLLTGPTRKRNMDDQMQTFRYLLGLSYQELGENKKAIQQFSKVYAYNTNFQDVSVRLKALNGI